MASEANRSGLAANKEGDFRGALSYFLTAHALQPTHAPFLISAANMLAKLGRFDEALSLYDCAKPLIVKPEHGVVLEAKRQAALEALAITAQSRPPIPAPAPPPAPPPPPPLPPQLPGKLLADQSAPTLDLCLGRGTYGVVWRGLDATFGTVAVKIVPMASEGDASDHGDGGSVKQQLADELELLSQATHRNVVNFRTAFCVPERCEVWVLMELAELGSFNTIVKASGPLPPAEVGAVLREALLGLQYLHTELHVLHRDIKAGNVLLTAEGVVKLADFGVSATTEGTLGIQHTVIGTPHWMAPEVIEGTDAGYDAHADVWSCGILAIELVEGAPPHADIKSPVAVMYRIVSGPPPCRSPLVHGQPFSDFLARCVAKDPQQRALCGALLTECALVSTAPPPELIQSLVRRASSAPNTSSGDCPAITDACTISDSSDGATLVLDPTMPPPQQAPAPAPASAPAPTAPMATLSSDHVDRWLGRFSSNEPSARWSVDTPSGRWSPSLREDDGDDGDDTDENVADEADASDAPGVDDATMLRLATQWTLNRSERAREEAGSGLRSRTVSLVSRGKRVSSAGIHSKHHGLSVGRCAHLDTESVREEDGEGDFPEAS